MKAPLLLAAVFSCLLGMMQAHANSQIVRAEGPGLFNPRSLSGPAAEAVVAYLSRTFVPCTVLREKSGAPQDGICNLRASTGAVQLLYAGDLALAHLEFEYDIGARSAYRTLLLRKTAGDSFVLLGTTDEIGVLAKAQSVRPSVEGMEVSGLQMGPNDPSCCPTTRVSYFVSYDAGRGVVHAEKMKEQFSATNYARKLPNALALLAGAPSQGHLLLPLRTAVREGPPKRVRHFLDLRRGELDGEPGDLHDLNGSEMLVFKRAGRIVYARPGKTLLGTVKPGYELFVGQVWNTKFEGWARAFKAGCTPVPYPVVGGRVGSFDIELRGKAPVWEKGSCRVLTYSEVAPNARLRFAFVPGD